MATFRYPFFNASSRLAGAFAGSSFISSWLEDYSLGDLWRKNIFTGGPVHE